MTTTQRKVIVGIGNVYVETNYLGLMTGGSHALKVGKEYRSPKWETRLGGSVVNFVVQAKRLGMEVGLIGKVGKDEAGYKLLSLLKEKDIASNLIVMSDDPLVQTSVDTGLVFEDAQNIQVVAGNANQSLSLKDIDLSNYFFDTVSAVYLGGFLKQTGLYKDYPELLKRLTDMGIRIFLDHGRIPVDVTSNQIEVLKKSMKYVEGYFPNGDELAGITGEQDVSKALDLAMQMGPKFVVVKLGKDGCRIKTKSEDIIIPNPTVKAISTVGAGDAFNAGFITQYLSNNSLKEAGKVACATAAIRVSKNTNPTRKEINDFLKIQY